MTLLLLPTLHRADPLRKVTLGALVIGVPGWMLETWGKGVAGERANGC